MTLNNLDSGLQGSGLRNLSEITPEVSTTGVSNRQSTQATVNGQLLSVGLADQVDVAVEYREVGTTTWLSEAVGTFSAPTAVSVTITGLTAGEEYEARVRADAVGAPASDVGAVVSFVAEIPQPASGISRYTFDDADTSSGTAVDVWGANNASINGATTGVTGASQTYPTNEAYSFDGTDDRLSPSDETVLDNLDAVTIACWFNTAQHDGNSHRIVSHISGSTFSDATLLTYGGGNNVYSFTAITGGNFGNDEITFPESAVTPGEWHHIVGVYDGPGNDMRLYLDAVEQASDGTDKNSLPSPGGLAIGARDDNSQFYFGELDDLRFYDKALTASEVSNLYNNGSIQ